MKQLKYIFISLALMVSIGLSAQNGSRKIAGTVTDATGEPVVGASVLIPGTTVGTSTDESGRYVLNVPEFCLFRPKLL